MFTFNDIAGLCPNGKHTHQGRLEAAKRKTRSSDLARPSIWTRSSVFMRLLPSCSLECAENQLHQKTLMILSNEYFLFDDFMLRISYIDKISVTKLAIPKLIKQYFLS